MSIHDKIDLTDVIRNKYPKMFKNCYDFSISNGWYGIVENLCQDISMMIDNNEIPQLYIAQIKEKFGGLRFYYDFKQEDDNIEIDEEVFDKLHKLVNDAEKECSITCETCGKPGKLITTGWLTVRCDEHK